MLNTLKAEKSKVSPNVPTNRRTDQPTSPFIEVGMALINTIKWSSYKDASNLVDYSSIFIFLHQILLPNRGRSIGQQALLCLFY